jgi:hypothetical protein
MFNLSLQMDQECFYSDPPWPDPLLPELQLAGNMSGNTMLQICDCWNPMEWEQLSLVAGGELRVASVRPNFPPWKLH